MAGESAGDSARRMREKADRLSRTAERWERGAEGERATAAALSNLPGSEWTAFHDLKWPGRKYANLDHVVVGPPGIFAIDSKNWAGAIEIVGGQLRHNGRRRVRELHAATMAAVAVAGAVDGVCAVPIFTVLCFVRDDALYSSIDRVTVCSTPLLTAVLGAAPPVLRPEERQQLCQRITLVGNASSPHAVDGHGR